ncbi:MAG: AI-2E family transporter [Chloroflexi bacterium]|nr:AI-2E family transporter [Chloroflexota bacterium]
MVRGRLVRILLILAALALALHVGAGLWSLSAQFADITVMFFMAWLLSFVLTPLVQFLSRHLRVARVIAAAAVYLVLFVAIITGLIILVPLLVTQMLDVARALPAYAERVPGLLAEIQADLDRRNVDVNLAAIVWTQDLTTSLTGVGTRVAQNAAGILAGAFGGVFATILIMILSFYMVVDGDAIERTFRNFIPDEQRADVDFFFESVNRSFGGFLRGTTIQAVIYGVGTAAVMLAGGLEYVLLSSVFAGIIMIIPIFGPFLAIIPPVLIAVTSTTPQTVLLIVGGLLILQQVTFNIIAPKVMSDSLGMHPILVFAALLVGARIGGITGAIFGLPIAAVLWALVRHILDRSRFGRLAAERQSRAALIAEHAARIDPGTSVVRRRLRWIIVGFRRVARRSEIPES